VTGDERDDLLHVEPLACFEVSLQVLAELRFKNDAELLAQL